MAKKAKTTKTSSSFLTGDGKTIDEIIPLDRLWRAESNGPVEVRRNGYFWGVGVRSDNECYLDYASSTARLCDIFVTKVECMKRVVKMREDWVRAGQEELEVEARRVDDLTH